MNYRVEIISNQSVQEEIIELMEEQIPGVEYTILPVVHGRGKSAKKLGTTTWPETNFLLFTYLSKEDAQKTKELIATIKQKFPSEGISIFFTKEENI